MANSQKSEEKIYANRKYTWEEWCEAVRDGNGIPKTPDNPLGAGRKPKWLSEFQEFLKFKSWKESGMYGGGSLSDTIEAVALGLTRATKRDTDGDGEDIDKGILQDLMKTVGLDFIDTKQLEPLVNNPFTQQLILKIAAVIAIPATVAIAYYLEKKQKIITMPKSQFEKIKDPEYILIQEFEQEFKASMWDYETTYKNDPDIYIYKVEDVKT